MGVGHRSCHLVCLGLISGSIPASGFLLRQTLGGSGGAQVIEFLDPSFGPRGHLGLNQQTGTRSPNILF